MTINLSLNPIHWNIRYSPGMPLHPSVDGTGWKFSFPVDTGHSCPAAPTQPPNYNISSCHHVDYVTTPFYTNLNGHQSISMTFSITGIDPIFDYHTASNNTGTTPATVRFLIERTSDAALNHPTYRWWSNPISFPLALTTDTVLTTPLDPSQWSDVNGQYGTMALSGFQDCLRHVGNLGMTFGGGSFFGHGNYLTSGSADFILTNFQID